MWWGYNNIWIAKGHEWNAAFQTNKGLFEPLVMFFGLCNSPSTFQKMMDSIFREELLEGWFKAYLDDLILWAETCEECVEHANRVLSVLEKNSLFLKPSKCVFLINKADYLGHIIKPGMIAVDPTKTEALCGWKSPWNKKDVQKFLGFGNYYH